MSPSAPAQFLCPADRVCAVSTLELSGGISQNTVGKFKRLSPEKVKIVVFQILKIIGQISSPHYRPKYCKSLLQTKKTASYLYRQTDTYSHIATCAPKHGQNVFFFFFSNSQLEKFLKHFRLNSPKYLPKADSMENFGPNGLSLAKL